MVFCYSSPDRLRHRVNVPSHSVYKLRRMYMLPFLDEILHECHLDPGDLIFFFFFFFATPTACGKFPGQGLNLHHRCGPKKHPTKTNKQKNPTTTKKGFMEFFGGLVVKHPVLSLLWLWSLLWCGFDPWPGNFYMLQVCPLKINKMVFL